MRSTIWILYCTHHHGSVNRSYQRKKTEVRYISFPGCNDARRRTNALLKNLHFSKRIILSGRTMKSVRRNVFTNLKSRKGIDSIVNASATVTCKNCAFAYKMKTGRLDLRRTLQHLERNPNSVIGKHLSEFPNHSMNEILSDIRQFGSRYECMLGWWFSD